MPTTLVLTFTPAIPVGQSAAIGAAVTFTQTYSDTTYRALRRDITSEDDDATLTGQQVRVLPYERSKPTPRQGDLLDSRQIQSVESVAGDQHARWGADLIRQQATHTVTLRRANTLRSAVVLAAGLSAGNTSVTIKAPTGDLVGAVVKGAVFTVAGISGTYTVTADNPSSPAVPGIAYYRCFMGVNP